jgi:hypothetical protein
MAPGRIFRQVHEFSKTAVPQDTQGQGGGKVRNLAAHFLKAGNREQGIGNRE